MASCLEELTKVFKDLELKPEVLRRMDTEIRQINKKLADSPFQRVIAFKEFRDNWEKQILGMGREKVVQVVVQANRVADFDEAIAARLKQRNIEQVDAKDVAEILLGPLEGSDIKGKGTQRTVEGQHTRTAQLNKLYLDDSLRDAGVVHLKDPKYALEIYTVWDKLNQVSKQEKGLDFKRDLIEDFNFDPNNPIHKIANLYREFNYKLVKDEQAVGLGVGLDPDHTFTSHHRAEHLQEYKMKDWLEDVDNYLDHDRPFMEYTFRPDDDIILTKLTGDYNSIIKHDFTSFTGRRSYNWKSPEAKLAYDLKYGSKLGHYEMMVGALDSSSRRQALASILGPDPTATMQRLFNRANEHNTGVEAFRKTVNQSFDAVRGAIGANVEGKMAKGARVLRSFGRAGELMKSARTAVVDVPNSSLVIRDMHGDNFVTGTAKLLQNTMWAAKEWAFNNAEFKRFLKKAGQNAEDDIHLMFSRVDETNSGRAKDRGLLAHFDYWMMNINMLRPITQILKGGSARYSKQALLKNVFDEGWDGMKSNRRDFLIDHGFEEVDFFNLELLGKIELGHTELTRLHNLSDPTNVFTQMEVPNGYLPPSALAGVAKNKTLAHQLKLQYAIDLRNKVLNSFGDIGDMSVTTQGIKQQRQLGKFSNIDPNGIAGIITANWRQYKSTPAKVTSTVFRRAEAAGGGKVHYAYAAGTSLMASTVTMAGALAMSGFAVGEKLPWEEEDFDETEYILEMMLRGGGLGLMGDMVLGLFDNNPSKIFSSFAGPLNNKLMRLIKIGYQGATGRDVSGQLIRMGIYNIPIVGHPFLYYVRKAMIDWNAEYLAEIRRIERRAQRGQR